MRREYTMFFAVNMVGLLIQSAGTGLLKYGFGMEEGPHRLAFNITTGVCIGIATLFRFWTYRTFVFKEDPDAADARTVANAPAEPVVTVPPIVAPAEGVPLPVPGSPGSTANGDGRAEFADLATSAETDVTRAEGAARTR
jgi:hypothetical protein